MRVRILSLLHAFIALNAIGGGIYGLSGASGVPTAWLDHTPFRTYMGPSLILLLIVGGIQSVASVSVARRNTHARTTSLLASVILLGWIIVQVALIGYVSWLQPAVAIAALVCLAFAARLKRDTRL